MISTVQTPFPIFAETAPKIWPHFCAPSPESETISRVCSASRVGLGGAGARVDVAVAVTVPAISGEGDGAGIGRVRQGVVVPGGRMREAHGPGLAQDGQLAEELLVHRHVEQHGRAAT